jgi:hypothetical protein
MPQPRAVWQGVGKFSPALLKHRICLATAAFTSFQLPHCRSALSPERCSHTQCAAGYGGAAMRRACAACQRCDACATWASAEGRLCMQCTAGPSHTPGRLFPAGFFSPRDNREPFLATLTVPLPVQTTKAFDPESTTNFTPTRRIPLVSWEKALHEVLQAGGEFRPDVVLLSLGLDGLKSDNIGTMDLSPHVYGKLVSQLGVTFPGAPILAILEGGYGKASGKAQYKDMITAMIEIQVR